MREVGMLLQQWEVKALLEGRKTRLTKVVKKQPPEGYNWLGWVLSSTDTKHQGYAAWRDENDTMSHYAKPPCQVGDMIWVRETFFQALDSTLQVCGEIENYWSQEFEYLADGKYERDHWKNINQDSWMVKRPSIHMPREAARIFLKVTDVRVERLQDITELEAQEEGFTAYYWQVSKFEDVNENEVTAKQQFLETLNTQENLWVWVIEIEIIQDYKGVKYETSKK